MKYILISLSIFMSLSLAAQTPEEAKNYHEQGRELLSEGKILEGREATKKALDMRRKLFGEVNEDYITSLNNYALTFMMENEYAEAERLQEKVMELCGKLDKPHPNLGMYTVNMGRCYYLNGDEDGAVEAWEKAMPMVEKHGEMYEFILNNLGMIYTDRKDVVNANRIMGLMEEHNRLELAKECNEPGCMLERAQYYAVTGDNAAAKEWYGKAFDMPMDDDMKLKAYEEYAAYLTSLNDFVSSAEYYVSAANLLKRVKGIDETYANYTYMAAIRYYVGSQFDKSIPYFQKSLDYYAPIDSPIARDNEARCWTGMGNSYSAMCDYVKAKEYHGKAVAYYEQNDRENEEYPKSLERLASAEKFNKDYDSAIEHYKQAMDIFDVRNMVEEYSNAANALKLCYAYSGKEGDVQMDEAEARKAQNKKLDGIIQEELGYLEMTRTYLGQLAYAQSLGVIAGCYHMMEDYPNSVKYYNQYVGALRNAVRDEFRMQNPDERMLTWNEQLNGIQSLRELLVELPADMWTLFAELTAAIYDAELLSKGILLNSSIEFERVLLAQGNDELIRIYETTKRNDAEIEQLRISAATEADLEKLQKLMLQNQNLQLQIYKGCAEFADFTDYMSYTWEDVRNSLTDKDIAIEFLAVERDFFDRDNYMVALILTKDMANPLAIPVSNLEQANSLVDYPDLFKVEGNLIWGLFDKYLEGKERIFFAADHSYNRVGIEYIPYNGKPLSEQFEVYRLSSTKEICKPIRTVKLERAAVFGDINYNDNGSYSIQAQRSVDALRAVGGDMFGNLDNTRREVADIASNMKKVKAVEMFTDTVATKTAFLNLSDTKVNVIHVATHGTYNASAKASDAEFMDNSLLVFAGANLTLGTGESLVSAAEVAAMNLRYCDLAVLSACETGLGGLGTDGVFGLQRGFKNAGVRTLLMSLKKVHDSATADLMSLFYANLMRGQTKREALVNAQKKLRTSGYEEPEYWASFILLDALE